MLLRRFTEADAAPLAALYGLGSFAAIEKETGQMAGRFSLKPANSHGLTGGTELGYRLYPAFWGRGLATEGSRALIASAFERLHLDRVVATTMADNIGSWRVLEKCGLRRVRTFHYPDADLMPGAEHGDVVYELTRSDWTMLVNPAEIEDRRPGYSS